MSDILLSIVIPAYNSGSFLNRTLAELVSQGLLCCEIIIVNDGSTDNTEAVCMEFANRYSEIRYIRQLNCGVSIARNTGIIAAKGKFIYFFDSDDRLTDNTLNFFRKILEYKCNDAPSIYVFGYELHKLDSTVQLISSNVLDKKELSPVLIKKKFLSKKIPWLICSCIFLKDFVLRHNLAFPESVKIGEDIIFMLQAIAAADSLYYNKRICYAYHIRKDSAMQGYKGYNADRMKSFEYVRDAVIKNYADYSSIEKEANFFIANSYLSNLVAYLKSDIKDKEINKIFLDNKFFLYRNLQGRFLNTAAIYIARCVPLRILFKLLK